MNTIHMLKGLPASGKSTLALQMVQDDGMKRVNKDLLREMLHGGKYTPELEAFVLDVRNAIIKLALEKGYDVVIDDTNLNPIHQEAIRNLAGVLGVILDVIEVDTPLEECIRRDKERGESVGENVIRHMFEKYVREQALGGEGEG